MNNVVEVASIRDVITERCASFWIGAIKDASYPDVYLGAVGDFAIYLLFRLST